MPNPTRRSLAAALALAFPLLGLAQGSGPIKIGWLTIDSGHFATYASLMDSGTRTAGDILNAEGGANGRKSELVAQAHSSTPAAALAAATKLAQQGGLFEKYETVIGNGFATDFQLESLGDNVLGVVNSLSWTPELPGARNEQTVKELVVRPKRRPFYTEVFRAGVVDALPSDPAKVRKALEGLKIDTVFGNVEMRAADHHLIRQHDMAQVVSSPGGVNTFTMKVVKPGTKIYPTASLECKAQV